MRVLSKQIYIVTIFFIIALSLKGQVKETINVGANESSPSRSEYFSWINNTNEGATEDQTLINLNFFEWLKKKYGMHLNIYAFDAGAIDGKRFYGNTKSHRFKKQFPHGFNNIYKKAKGINIRLGVWGGPDGFGNTPEEEKERTDQMVSLCKDYDFALFKFDAVCGQLRPEKESAFTNMMEECRTFSPDLILLNHRLGLENAQKYATTFLWEGRETYIDVFSVNNKTAPHHRGGVLNRGLVPGLQRLTEDHGVCLSSCLDYWEDDLILQTFNRNLILSPQIYGNPWLLRDDEFPLLARIFNLHEKYKDILINGIELPKSYGPSAVSRGNEKTRIITLRNLTWNKTVYHIQLDEEIGLKNNNEVEVIQLHPTESYIGKFNYGDSIDIAVLPFRSCMIIISSEKTTDPIILGTNFQLIKDIPDEPVLIEILGMPGTSTEILIKDPDKYSKALLNNQEANSILEGTSIKIKFPGEKLNLPYHRFLGELSPIEVPKDVEALYEATVFSANNNALEVRSIERSGWSGIPEVLDAQQAFFEQEVFVNRGIWDKNLFDEDLTTGFWQSKKYNIDQSIKGGCFRFDLGEIIKVDSIVLKIPDYFSLHPLLKDEAFYFEFSTNLKDWKVDKFLADTSSTLYISSEIRYLRMNYFPQRISEVMAFKNNQKLNSSHFSASNLFASSDQMKAHKAWSMNITSDEISKNAYLCIALEGQHGIEGAYAAIKIDGEYYGCPDRAPSYPSNTWEYVNARKDNHYTYYFPLDQSMVNKEIEVFVISYNQEFSDFKSDLWITAYPTPYEKIQIELGRK